VFCRQLSETLGKWHFWLTLFFAYNAFLPMHITGLAGEPRHYAQLTGLTPAATALLQSTLPLQRYITTSAIALGLVQLLFLFNLARTLLRPPNAPANPWNATTLEWAPEAMAESDAPLTVTRAPCLYSPDGDEFFPQWESDSTPAASNPE
jgi:cytochrome c oxidase subunit 1